VPFGLGNVAVAVVGGDMGISLGVTTNALRLARLDPTVSGNNLRRLRDVLLDEATIAADCVFAVSTGISSIEKLVARCC
jgi:hypothetical protein